MLFLDKKAWLDGFEKCEEANCAEVTGMTENELDTMVRLLKAKSSTEIDDIPTEVIISMFEFIPAFASSVGKTTVFSNLGSGDGNFVHKLLSLPSASLDRKRRVI